MVRALPSFSGMWENYPKEDRSAVATAIGGRVAANVLPTLTTSKPWNTCAIRVSRAFNYAGDPIPRNHVLQKSKDKRLLAVLSGDDKKWYAFRVADLMDYIDEVYGSASGGANMNANDDLAAVLPAAPCLVTFNFREKDETTHVDRAANHIDLWDGSEVRYNPVLLTEPTGYAYVMKYWEFAG